MALIALSLAWVVGIYLGSLLSLPWGYGFIGLFLLLGLAFLPRKRGLLLLLGLSLALFLGGALRSTATQPPLDEHSLAFYQGQKLKVEGIVAEAEVVRDGQRLFLEARKIQLNGQDLPLSGIVQLWLPPLPTYQYGDVLAVRGKLEPPGEVGARQGFSGIMSYPEVKALGRGKGSPFLEALSSLRQRLSQALARTLPEPQAAIAQGILLGLRGQIPSELNRAFSQTGTTHILAISGLNISILAGILLSFGAWVFGRHRPYYLLLALAGAWLYVLLSGFRPPAVRAGIMGSLFLAAQFLGRPRAAFPALALTAAVLLGIKPTLLWDVAFQLSFLAMAGLVLLAPPFQALVRKTPLPTPVVDSLAFTLGAILATFPLVAYYFHIFSLVGLPATLFALPVLPGIILLSALVAGVGLVLPPLAIPLGWLAWLFLSYFIGVAMAFAALPQPFLQVRELSPLWVWAYYLGLGLALALPHLRGAGSRLKATALSFWGRLPQRGLALALLLPAILIWVALFSLPDQRVKVSFLDVGQGDAILIQQGRRQILIDGGPDPQRLNLTLGKRLPFWNRHLDLVVLTHPDEDHITGLVEIFKRYKVDRLLEPGWPSSGLAYGEVLRLAQEKEVAVLQARAGQQFVMGKARLVVLHPQGEWLTGTETDDNNNGVVLRLEIGDTSFLFTGDLRAEGEGELLMRRERLRSTVLKVAHHGSRTSTSPKFLAVVNPQVAVISAGEGFGHPHQEVADRLKEEVGERLYITRRQGSIDLFTDGQRLWLKTER